MFPKDFVFDRSPHANGSFVNAALNTKLVIDFGSNAFLNSDGTTQPTKKTKNGSISLFKTILLCIGDNRTNTTT